MKQAIVEVFARGGNVSQAHKYLIDIAPVIYKDLSPNTLATWYKRACENPEFKCDPEEYTCRALKRGGRVRVLSQSQGISVCDVARLCFACVRSLRFAR